MVKKKNPKPYIEDSICCDGSFVWTNNMMEWQVRDTLTEEYLVYQRYGSGSPNLAEFLAIIDAMMYLESNNTYIPIYTDSSVAMKWIEDGKSRTTATVTHEVEDLITEYEDILENIKSNHQVLKWNTKEWGEIPADFGRKKKKRKNQ